MDVLQVFTVAVGVIGGLGGLVGFFSKSRFQAIIKLQTEEIDVLTKRLATEKIEKASALSERDAYKEHAARLAEMAQGSPQLIELAKEIAKQSRQLTKLTEAVIRNDVPV